jgi:hypothetical protein
MAFLLAQRWPNIVQQLPDYTCEVRK